MSHYCQLPQFCKMNGCADFKLMNHYSYIESPNIWQILLHFCLYAQCKSCQINKFKNLYQGKIYTFKIMMISSNTWSPCLANHYTIIWLLPIESFEKTGNKKAIIFSINMQLILCSCNKLANLQKLRMKNAWTFDTLQLPHFFLEKHLKSKFNTDIRFW